MFGLNLVFPFICPAGRTGTTWGSVALERRLWAHGLGSCHRRLWAHGLSSCERRRRLWAHGLCSCERRLWAHGCRGVGLQGHLSPGLQGTLKFLPSEQKESLGPLASSFSLQVLKSELMAVRNWKWGRKVLQLSLMVWHHDAISILAWRIPWTGGPEGCSPWGHRELATPEHTCRALLGSILGVHTALPHTDLQVP